jgi:riboflavin kinase / FMN adenylyltransferase
MLRPRWSPVSTTPSICHQRPAYGVYAVRARIGTRLVDGVANIGLRPSFSPPRELLEVHLLDFAGDLYAQPLTVDIIAFIRPERRFASLDALRAQIAVDRATAEKILRQPAFSASRFPILTRADFEG